MMKNAKYVEVNVGGKIIRFETGVLAKQAAGSVTVQIGDTILFSAVTCTKTPREGIDFFPLQVEYREKFYSAGRFPGGYFKRESRPSEKEILTARVTDRPIRPLFPKGYFNDVQINNSVISADGENDSDFLSILGASAALTLSEIPFMGPIAAVRVGIINGQYVLNPTHSEIATNCTLQLVYAGTRDYPLMIEGESSEITNEQMIGAMKFGHEAVVKLVDAQLELRRLCGLPAKVIEKPVLDDSLFERGRAKAGKELSEALMIKGKLERQDKVSAIRESLKAALLAETPDLDDQAYFQMFDRLEIECVRKNVLDRGHRIDGRKFNELRPLDAQVGFLPRTHGSSMFQRGETQSLAIVTLGTGSDKQDLDGLTGGPKEKSFMLHYNFPPYSVGEAGRLGSTSRREIGHGNLAERAIKPVIPADYPYTVRVVSEIMESNGSSSMASACAGTLALLDAGVPLTSPVAGISVGLFSAEQGDRAELVLDILGAEDHCGDMDFKVCGTRKGITSFQVDLKVAGLRWDLVEKAFEMARVGRSQILDFMQSVIAAPRSELSKYAPRIQILPIDPEKIGMLIGPGGKNIRRITDTYAVQIDIDDSGTVTIFSSDGAAMEGAVREVQAVTAEVEEGKIYHGTVRGIKDFGAFVECLPGKDGLVHISELADYRVNRVDDICKMGEKMWVKCIGIDDNGKVRLSRKAALKEMGDEAK